MTSPHTLIRASAGTGKTYQLSGRYLALLFRRVPPERILATTFTRKAAGEILDRVLRRLVDSAESPKKLAELNEQLAGESVPAVTAEDCVALLGELTRALHRCRVRTLDAFFVQLAGVFALDLGLPPEWRILDDDEVAVLSRDALSAALADAEPAEVLELLRALQRTDASRLVERSLNATIDAARDAYLDSGAPAWDRVRVPERLDEGELEDALAALEAMPLPRTKKGDPNKTWANALAALLRRARAGDWEKALDTGILKKLTEGETKFGTDAIEPEHRRVLDPFLRQAAHALLARVRAQNLASHAWLERFEASFLARKDAASGLSFEDVPRALAPGTDAVHAVRDFDLGYRLDGRIDHLLLDEFQDTAPSQWRVLAPLAEEIVAHGGGDRTFFCVGDAKQSIYAWRSGEPRLLSGMNERFPALPPPTDLVESYRSSRVVLDTVDRVFGALATSGAFKEGAQRAAALAFQEQYVPHVAARELPGSVTLYEARVPDDDEPRRLPALELAADRAAALASEAPHATIAVLLRRNADVARAIDLLRRRGLRASGEGGNPLVDSAAVLHALSALHLADHPGDSAAAFHVVTSPLAEALGAAGVDARDRDQRVALSRSLRARLAREGLGPLLAGLAPAVEAAPGYGPWDRKRFGQLVDLGYTFDRREELRTGAFLDFVRKTKVEDPTSTQITVMTVHASKGLEFDAVILPELDLSMTLRPPEVLRSRPAPERPFAGVSVSASHAVCGLDPEGLGSIRAEEDQRHVQEALCILYVALTRAAHRLDLVVRPRGKGTRTLSYATVLRDTLLATPSVDVTGEPRALWRHPDSSAAWWPAPPETVEASQRHPARRRPCFRAPTAQRDLPRKSPSAEEGTAEGGHTVDVAELLRPRAGRGFTRGALIHRWLEELEWLDDAPIDERRLDALGAELERDPAARAEALAALRTALEHAEVRALLTRPEGDVEVWRERDFSELLPDEAPGCPGGTALWTGSFDRVVLHRGPDGELDRADVIDFKTDRIDASGVDVRAAFYAPQLASYARVLVRMTDLPPERVGTVLCFLEPGIVRRLER